MGTLQVSGDDRQEENRGGCELVTDYLIVADLRCWKLAGSKGMHVRPLCCATTLSYVDASSERHVAIIFAFCWEHDLKATYRRGVQYSIVLQQ